MAKAEVVMWFIGDHMSNGYTSMHSNRFVFVWVYPVWTCITHVGGHKSVYSPSFWGQNASPQNVNHLVLG